MGNKPNRPSLKIDEKDLLLQPKLIGVESDNDAQILAAADELSVRHGALRSGVARSVSSIPSKPFESPRSVMSLGLPEYLDLELSLNAAQRKVSKGFLILEALAKVGYQVKEEDLVGDRRRKRK